MFRLGMKIRSGEYIIDQPQWDQYSADLKDLVKNLLCVNPQARLTSDQALAHPWILCLT